MEVTVYTRRVLLNVVLQMFAMIDFMSVSAVIAYYESVTVLHAGHTEMDVDKVLS